jgi:hypothetical protein
VGTLTCDLCPGEGRAVQVGDSVEVRILQANNHYFNRFYMGWKLRVLQLGK